MIKAYWEKNAKPHLIMPPYKKKPTQAAKVSQACKEASLTSILILSYMKRRYVVLSTYSTLKLSFSLRKLGKLRKYPEIVDFLLLLYCVPE